MSVSARQHPRVPATFPLTYVVAGESAVRQARTRDISGGGLSFDTPAPIVNESALIAIAFEIRGIRIKARARVVGSNRDAANAVHTYRCVFAEISFETQTLLAAYVLRNSLDAILTKALHNVM